MAIGYSDDPFALAMSSMRRHLKDCYECRYTFSTNGDKPLCLMGMRLASQVAIECDSVLKLKRAAGMSKDATVYACPDLSKHGEAYALAAIPFTVTGMQEGLF